MKGVPSIEEKESKSPKGEWKDLTSRKIKTKPIRHPSLECEWDGVLRNPNMFDVLIHALF